jgi:hypothetical protein
MHSTVDKEEIRAKIKKRLEEKAAKKLAPEPRYDEEFFEGVAWLDSLMEEED